MKMWKCPKCGFENYPNGAICVSCGFDWNEEALNEEAKSKAEAEKAEEAKKMEAFMKVFSSLGEQKSKEGL